MILLHASVTMTFKTAYIVEKYEAQKYEIPKLSVV